MSLIIAPDIFGRTPALERLSHRLADGLATKDVDIVDPYGGNRWFRREDQAYAHFSARLGIPAYSRRIADRIAALKPPVTLLGFSAGASAIWHLSGNGPPPGISGAVGFYGAQIRHFSGIRPAFDIHLIFPASESHFDVDELISRLAATPRVSLEKSAGGHGFMNEYSHRFDGDLCTEFLKNRIPELTSRRGSL